MLPNLLRRHGITLSIKSCTQEIQKQQKIKTTMIILRHAIVLWFLATGSAKYLTHH